MCNGETFNRDVMVPTHDERPLPGDPNYELMPDSSEITGAARELAYRIYVELSTRKVGLPIDWENDCIHEIYNSWFNFMQAYRESLKNACVRYSLEDKDYDGGVFSTGHLIGSLIYVLNEVFRPHITKWSARYRAWYRYAETVPDNFGKAPQDIQVHYPGYDDLRKDMDQVCARMIALKEALAVLVVVEMT